MTDLFLKIVKIVLKNEGGYVNDPDDPGGKTRFGISKRAFPDLDIENLTIDQAKEIYYDKYWLPLSLEAVNDPEIALQIFDMGVNAGISKAARLAQEVSGVYVDGHIGPATILAINNTECFVDKYKNKRIHFYTSLKGSSKFLKGWIKRVENTILA